MGVAGPSGRKAPSGRTRRDAVHDDVLDAVERLLTAGERFTALGVQRICDEAGVAKSAFYVNFAGKSDLLLRLVESATESLFAASNAWLGGSGEVGFEELVATERNSIRVWREHAPLISAYFEVAAYDAEVAGFWEQRIEVMIGTLARRFEREGAGRRVDPRTAAEVIVRGSERTTASHVATRPASEDDRLARQVAEVLWRVLMDD